MAQALFSSNNMLSSPCPWTINFINKGDINFLFLLVPGCVKIPYRFSSPHSHLCKIALSINSKSQLGVPSVSYKKPDWYSGCVRDWLRPAHPISFPWTHRKATFSNLTHTQVEAVQLGSGPWDHGWHFQRKKERKWSRSVVPDSLRPHGL